MVAPLQTRSRKALEPPSGFEGYLSRQQAAAELGLASEYKIRQLEREGKLRPVRGVMGSAWYPRAEVLALRPLLEAPVDSWGGRRRWSDSELVAWLRQGPRTPADLVVQTGVSIARAQRVYRFWREHDWGRTPEPRLIPALETPVASPVGSSGAPASVAASPVAASSGAPASVAASRAAPSPPPERRGPARQERDALIRQLRDPDPRIRSAAFEKLRSNR